MIRLVISKNNLGSVSPLPKDKFAALFGYKAEANPDLDTLSAYLTLDAAYKRLFGENMPLIIKSGTGRPEFQTKSKHAADFNLSHTDGVSVVAIISDGGQIGVDAERERDIKNAPKIAERCLQNINNNLQKTLTDAEITFAEVNGDGVEFFDTVRVDALKNGEIFRSICGARLSLSDDENFFSRWTLLEAALKAQGSGFRLLKEAPSILSRSESLTLSLKTESADYKISLCHLW